MTRLLHGGDRGATAVDQSRVRPGEGPRRCNRRLALPPVEKATPRALYRALAALRLSQPCCLPGRWPLSKEEATMVTLSNIQALQMQKPVSGAKMTHVETINGKQIEFSNTLHVSSDSSTGARTIGVASENYSSQLTVILTKTADSVNVSIVPLDHPTMIEPLEFTIKDPTEPPPPPDFTFSAGWFGWAGSFSEAEVTEILAAASGPVGTAVRATVTAIVGHFNWIAGLIVAFVLAVGPFLIKFFDDWGKDRGVCFVETWLGIWWLQPNPAPWGF